MTKPTEAQRRLLENLANKRPARHGCPEGKRGDGGFHRTVDACLQRRWVFTAGLDKNGRYKEPTIGRAGLVAIGLREADVPPPPPPKNYYAPMSTAEPTYPHHRREETGTLLDANTLAGYSLSNPIEDFIDPEESPAEERRRLREEVADADA